MSNNPTILEELVKHIEEHGLCVIKNQSRFQTGYKIWKKIESFYKLTDQKVDYYIVSPEHGISIRAVYKPGYFNVSHLPDLNAIIQCMDTVKKTAINHSFVFVLDLLLDSEDIKYEWYIK